MPRRSVAATLVSNSRWNFIAFGVSVVANFVAIPVAIAAIGLNAFGAASLVLAIYAPFSLVGTVIGQALVRELSPRIAAGDRDGCIGIISAAIALGATGCLFVILIVPIIGVPIMGTIVGPSGVKGSWLVALFICGIGWIAQQGCFILQAVLASTQNYGRLAFVGSIAAIASATSIALWARVWPETPGFLLGTATGFCLSFVLLVVLLIRELPWLKSLRRFTFTEFRSLVEFGKWQGAASFAGALGNQADRYVLGILSPLATVGAFNVAMRLQEVVYMGVLKIAEVLYPHFSITNSQPMKQRATFFVRASWLMNMVAVTALAPLIPLADSLVTLWVGADAASAASPILRTLATAAVIGSGANVYVYFAMASTESPRAAILTIAHSAFLAVSTVVLIGLLGPVAAGAGYVLANLLRLLIVTQLSSRYFVSAIRPKELIASTLPPLAGGLLASWLISIMPLPSASDWFRLAFTYMMTGVVICFAAVLVTSLSGTGRRLVQDTYAMGGRIITNKRRDGK